MHFPPYGVLSQEVGSYDVPSFDERRGIRSNNILSVPSNKFEQRVLVTDNEDCTVRFGLNIFELSDPRREAHEVLCRGEAVIKPTQTSYGVSDDLFDRAFDRVKKLENDQFEIWPANHNVHEGYHFADPWGEVTEILTDLSSGLDITAPLVDHNKISSRQVDKYGCNELHLDSFEGMRKDEGENRQRIFRHFLNLGDTPRTTLVALHDTNLVDRCVGPDYRPDYLDPIINTARAELPVLKLTLPPRDPESKMVYGYKLLTTHLVHGEFGPKDDLLAIVNSTT